jgi:Fe-S-cluster-containing hydrogenase component 2
MRVLVFNPELCDGCGICEETCSQTYFKVADRAHSAIRISEAPGSPGSYQALVCSQCGECIDVCPTLAIDRDKRGIVRIRKADCVGCLSCVGFCPLLAMQVPPDGVVPFKCVACGKCAEACPTGALAVEELPDAGPTRTEQLQKAVA